MDPIAQKVEHTLLRADASAAEIKKLCAEAKEHQFYAVCVNPSWISLAKRELSSSSVKIVSVVGFPLGANLSASKAYETQQCIRAGAHEIDMVISIGALKDRDDTAVVEDIEGVLRSAESCPVKVIIETALLSEAEKIRACELAVKAGALFIKTSTGYGPSGATVEDVKLIRKTVGDLAGIKASGGIATRQQALELIEAGATRLGSSKSLALLEKK